MRTVVALAILELLLATAGATSADFGSPPEAAFALCCSAPTTLPANPTGPLSLTSCILFDGSTTASRPVS